MKKIIYFFILVILIITALMIYYHLKKSRLKEAPRRKISAEDTRLLEEVERKGLGFFLNEVNVENGLVKDRANNFNRSPLNYSPSSVAAVGFGLTILCVGAERNWLSTDEVYKRVLRTLKFFKNLTNVHGFYYHFLDMKTGVRTYKSELSPVDTALFLAGALFAGEYFRGTEVESLANELYERVDWQWMMNGGRTLALGWTPEDGFIEYRWDHYCESMLMYLMAIGSPTHPIKKSAWDDITRPIGQYGGHINIVSPPLFTHQYSHIWVDFRNKYDNYADYFENSVQATLANRQFCIDNMKDFKTYNLNVWGLTACDGPKGYKAYGAKPGRVLHDGTVAPTAAIGSIVFTPAESIAFIKNIKKKFPYLWGQYGFVDSFNIDQDWYDRDVLAIDQGTIVLMIENYLSGAVWKTFMSIPFINRAMALAGFKEGKKVFDYSGRIFSYFDSREDKRPDGRIPFVKGDVDIDGSMDDWNMKPQIRLSPGTNLESGAVDDTEDINAKIYLQYDNKNLYILAVVHDDQLVVRQTGDKIYIDDCIEVYIDPENNHLQWGSKNDFQLGFTASGPGKQPQKWAWFQNNDGGEKVLVKSRLRDYDYIIEISIGWDFIGITPEKNKDFGFTVSLHDRDVSSEAKLTWFFHEPGILLGQVILE